MTGRGLPAAGAVVLALFVAGCTSPDRPRVQPDVVPMASPMQTFGAGVGATVLELQAAVAARGERIDVASGPFRPPEPQALLEVPRVVLRVALADADDGFVVVYEAADAASAEALADELADYLGSGFGQTNFPAGTRFSVAVLGETIVFTAFSAARSSDPDRAEGAFEAVASVGRPVEVAT